MLTIVGVRPVSSSSDGPIWAPSRPGANKQPGLCVWNRKSNRLSWIQPKTGTNYGALQKDVLNGGGLNKVTLSSSDDIDKAVGDGSAERMKVMDFLNIAKDKVCNMSCCVFLLGCLVCSVFAV